MICLAGLALAACTGAPGETSHVLSEGDRQYMADTTRQALDTQKDGQGINWENPESGSAGSVTLLRSYQSGSGTDCRDFQQTATAGDGTWISYGGACRQEDGSWQIIEAVAHGPPYPVFAFRFGTAYRYPHIGYRPFWFAHHRRRHPFVHHPRRHRFHRHY